MRLPQMLLQMIFPRKPVPILSSFAIGNPADVVLDTEMSFLMSVEFVSSAVGTEAIIDAAGESWLWLLDGGAWY